LKTSNDCFEPSATNFFFYSNNFDFPEMKRKSNQISDNSTTTTTTTTTTSTKSSKNNDNNNNNNEIN